jgi:hypothetical protein
MYLIFVDVEFQQESRGAFMSAVLSDAADRFNSLIGT